jgi:phosphatidylinositol alpha-mannosyltransferase
LSRSLKIGFVLDVSLDTTDGVQQYVLGVGEWLRTQGYDVHYLVGNTLRTDITNVHNMGRNVTVRFNGNATGTPLPASTRKIREMLTTEQFDILHVQLPYSPFLAHKIIMNAPDQTAIVGTFHILPHSWVAAAGSKLLYYWTWRSWKKFDAIFSVSTAAQVFARRTFHVVSDVVPNVIYYQDFANAKPFEKAMPTILFLGRLVPRKGCLTLLQAVKILQTDSVVPDFNVLICGRGRLEAELKAYAAAERLERVAFTGFVTEENKPRYYATSDISVFPSNGGESFGIVLLEAMASGQAAVLAGDNAGYRAVLEDRPELLFPPKDSIRLAEKLKHYLMHEEDRCVDAAWGKTYTAGFDVNIVGTELLKRYNKVLRPRRNMP